MSKRELSKIEVENWRGIHVELLKLVVSGNHEQVKKILSTISPKKIPREWAVQFGEIAYKVHSNIYSLKALHRFVRPDNSFAEHPTDKEKLIYASALYSLGSIEDSLDLIGQINSEHEPETLFHRALAGFYKWDYEGGSAFLENYVSSTKISATQRLLGKINLAAALVMNANFDRAKVLLEQIESECLAGPHKSFLPYCYEIQAQSEIFCRRFENARPLLAKAFGLISGREGIYKLFIEKWICINECMLSPNEENLKKLRQVRDRAKQILHWETIRECDLFEAVAYKNEALFRKVVMGTPSEHYRQRARKFFGEKAVMFGQYELLLGEGEAKNTFDSVTTKLYLKPQLLKVFDALLVDFYKPSTLGVLFQRVFDNEVFNPFSSPPRLLSLMRRLDEWFVENGHSLRVDFKKSEFSLMSIAPVKVRVVRGKKTTSDDVRAAEIKKTFAQKTFTTQQVAEALRLSKSAVRELLDALICQGKIIQGGQGRGTTYRFVSPRQRRAAA